MKQELIFGAAYYDEYMPYDRLDKDVEMMKAAGINTVRIAESTWSTLEPREGQYDFRHIDRVLECMEKNGIQVIVGTMTYAIPSWLAKKDPDILVVRKSGQARYGARQNMNIMNPVYRECAGRTVRELIRHVAFCPCVIGYQIDNETKHYDAYNESIQAGFKQYLKERFKTVEVMNRAFGFSYWSNSIADWDDLPDVRGTINASYGCEYEKYLRMKVSEFLEEQADIVREYKRDDQFLTHNFDFEWKKFGYAMSPEGYSYGVQPGCDHFLASKAVDIAGTDIYHPTQDHLTGAEIAFCGDEIRSLKNDNYLVLETQAQAFKEWLPYEGQLRLHAYSHLASGASGLMYWHWHSIHNSFETYWKGLLSHDMESNPTYEEASVIVKEWKAHSKELSGIKKRNRIAVLVSNESLSALKWFPADCELSYNDIVRWVYDSLYEINLECDIISAYSEDIEKYDMIVAPALYCVNKGIIERLNKFVRKGGVLVSSFRSFVADTDVKVFCGRQPYGMTECFGMSYNQFTRPENAKVSGKECRFFMELLRPETAEVLYRYEDRNWGKYGAVSRNQYGKGSAYYIATYLEKNVLKEILKRAAADAEITIPAYQWPVTIRNGENTEGKKIHFILHYSPEEQNINNPFEKVRDVLTGMEYDNGQTIKLAPWGVCVMEEK